MWCGFVDSPWSVSNGNNWLEIMVRAVLFMYTDLYNDYSVSYCYL